MGCRCIKVTLENFYGKDDGENTKLTKALEVFLNKIGACRLDCNFAIDEGVDEINTLLMEQFRVLHVESDGLIDNAATNTQAMLEIAEYFRN